MNALALHPLPWKATKHKTCWTIKDANNHTVVIGKCGQLDSGVVDCIIKSIETVQYVASLQNLFFTECTQAEEIVERCRKVTE